MQVITMIKGDDRFVFTFDENEEARRQILRKVAEYAQNPELSFDWHDAASVAQQVRKGALIEL